jgi:hypothetical protein
MAIQEMIFKVNILQKDHDLWFSVSF